MQKISPRLWISLILVGLTGQFAWTIENMYFNVFLYNTITTDPGAIAAMVSASAITATLTTLLIGALSDRLGRRRAFICGGYLLWGVSTAAFGFITVENAAKLLPAMGGVAGAALLVIVMDCLMTFFGSTANDAAFNAYVTEQVPDDQRGKVEGVLAILPLMSMLVIFGLFDGMTQAGKWQSFFLIFGGMVIVSGLAACFLLPAETPAPRRQPYFRQLVHGFLPGVVRENKALYWSMASMCVFSIAVQVFFPYLIIYLQHYLHFDAYAIVLGVVLLFASVVSVLFGRQIDKHGKLAFAIPSAVLMFVGLIGLFFARSMVAVILTAMVVMSGYMLLTSALGAQIRELTPEGQAGHFQGIRMIFAVMLPMIIGPFLGAAVIRGNAATYVELGQIKTVPTPAIFLTSAVVLCLLALPLWRLAKALKPAPEPASPLYTKWGKALDRDHPLPEYPRPQCKRSSYLNLNGPWEYAITESDNTPDAWEGEIIVPFSPESVLSGVNRTLHAHETLWYRRKIVLPQNFVPENGRLILHFGAVDQEADVYLNGVQVCHHMGGYNAFSADVTDALSVENTLIVRVHDDTDASCHSRGKQKTKRGGIWYTPQSGIWQTVWMEAVPSQYIHSFRMIPHYDDATVEITVYSDDGVEGSLVLEGARYSFKANVPQTYPVQHFTAWSPENPYLYPITLSIGDDLVESYFAMRKTEIREDEHGVKRLFLNNQPCFHNGLLDQGYWPDGLYTPPSDEAMIFDIQTAKDLGYNLLRKHIKVEPMRWYYHCDRLGMLVWQDMVNGGGEYRFMTISAPLVTGIHRKDTNHAPFARESAQGRAEYEFELEEMVHQLFNVPSIVLWVPFNEGWGQFDAERICRRLYELDPTRPIDHASGWHDQKIGDLRTLHVYFMPYRFKKDPLNRAVALSEFGGYNLRVDGHCFNQTDYGYKKLADADALWAAYHKLYESEILPAIPQGLCAAVYTQLTDVEDELNGILTYDREVLKLPADALKQLNEQIIAAGGRQ